MSFAHPIRHTCCGKLLIFVDFLRERLSTDTTLFTTETDTHHANSIALTNNKALHHGHTEYRRSRDAAPYWKASPIQETGRFHAWRDS